MLTSKVRSRRDHRRSGHDWESSGIDRPRTSVLLADDHGIVRQGLHALLEREQDLLVVGDAEDGREAVRMAKALHPDIVVIDDSMPRLNGIEATRRMLEFAPTTRVIVLSAHDDDEYAERATAVGAAGYVPKQSSIEDLLAAIRTVRTGRTFISPSISCDHQSHVRWTPNVRGGRPTPLGLTSRQAEVLQAIAESRCNKEIARELGISIKTVEKHRQHLMAKLDIHDVAGLTRYAVESGAVECGVGD